jgi:hypothetical protein
MIMSSNMRIIAVTLRRMLKLQNQARLSQLMESAINRCHADMRASKANNLKDLKSSRVIVQGFDCIKDSASIQR